MELEILYIISMIISFVCIVVQRNHNKWLFDKLKSKTSENERHTPIDTSSLKKSCEDKIIGDKMIWDVPYSKYRDKYKKIAEPIYNEFNYNFEVLNKKEENKKMNKKQLKESVKHLYSILEFNEAEIRSLRDEVKRERNHKRVEFATVTETKIFIATPEEIEEAKCCKTCTALEKEPLFFCANAIMGSYTGIDAKKTKCDKYVLDEENTVIMIKEMRENKEHKERVKKANLQIVKIDKEEK